LNDKGNDVVQRRQAIFAAFQGGKANQQVHDPIGRAWAVGLLDGYDADAATIRDAGRDYAFRYWRHYPTDSGVSNYDREDRRGGGGGGTFLTPDPGGERFQRLDRIVLDAGRAAYDAMQSLCVDHYWFDDENPAWLDRLINEQRVKRDASVAGMLPMRGDKERLDLAVSALLAIVQGTRKRSGDVSGGRPG
jgi:hypothetical protein